MLSVPAAVPAWLAAMPGLLLTGSLWQARKTTEVESGREHLFSAP